MLLKGDGPAGSDFGSAATDWTTLGFAQQQLFLHQAERKLSLGQTKHTMPSAAEPDAPGDASEPRF